MRIQRRNSNQIYSHVRGIWLVETPEERVRQEYLIELVNEYGYELDQIKEEQNVTGRGSAQARADFVIWKSVADKNDGNCPLIIVECKSDNVSIRPQDYIQGDLYARIANAQFVVTHNNSETKYWRVKQDKMPGYLEEIENIPHADATEDEIKELYENLRVFREDEFANVLHQCHNIIRNREKKDPAAAFDEIAKLLFIKVWVERMLKGRRQGDNLFTVEFLQSQISRNPIQRLFQDTIEAYREDGIFEKDEQINLQPETVEAIVRLLERYNLSETSEDIKGIAFERFLGRTFRGEMGQFFTPRTIVEFMIRMLDPQEGELVCDPASGSGGFLIRYFETVREKIFIDVDQKYKVYKLKVESDNSLSDEEKGKLLTKKYDELQKQIDPLRKSSRTWKLSNDCIYGCDANDRMAKTSKMNMIMHGDGHGGVHHHDGFVNVNGVFDERFDLVFTNPPFGASVEIDDKITDSMVISTSSELYQRRLEKYGEDYRTAHKIVADNVNEPIASLYDLGKSLKNIPKKVNTEILFIERCIKLLKPGGRLGIVLPDGILNNPSLEKIRDYVENKAYLLAVVSLSSDTFLSSGASVKASLLFLQKFSENDQAKYRDLKNKAYEEVFSSQSEEREILTKIISERPKQSDFYPEGVTKPTAEQKESAKSKKAEHELILKQKKPEAKERFKELDKLLEIESRRLFREKFSYPVFFYDAEKVGISATGEEDKNELYPNPNIPEDVVKSALELYNEFLENPNNFLVK